MPLDLLKEEQERIARRLGSIESRLKTGQVEYDQAKAHLNDCLALAANMHTVYSSIDDTLRRIANQAFFERIYVHEDTIEPGTPFDILLDPDVHAHALTAHSETASGTADGAGGRTSQAACLNVEPTVGDTGIEPVTSSVSGKRAPAAPIARAGTAVEVETGVEPVLTALQAAASPLGHSTVASNQETTTSEPMVPASERMTGLEPATLTLAR